MAFIRDSEGTIYSSNSSLNDLYLSQETDDPSMVSETGRSENEFIYSDNSPGACQNLLTNKVQVYKKTIEEANLAYNGYKISEFILNTYKDFTNFKTQTSQKDTKFVNEIILSCRLKNAIKLKTKSGESISFLGLDDYNVETNNYLTTEAQSRFHENILRNLEDKVEKLKLKRKSIKEILGEHYPNQAVYLEDFPCQEKLIKFMESYNNLMHKIIHLEDAIKGLVEIIQELLNIQQSNKIKELELKSISIIMTKVKYMKCITSILEKKTQLLLYKSRDQIHIMNTCGKEYEQNVTSLREKVSTMKASIGRYRSKEKLSTKFVQLIQVYGRTMVDLKSKQQTLSLLNQTDTASLNQMYP